MSHNEIRQIQEIVEGVVLGRLVDHGESKLVGTRSGGVVRVGRAQPRIAREVIKRIAGRVGAFTAQQLLQETRPR